MPKAKVRLGVRIRNLAIFAAAVVLLLVAGNVIQLLRFKRLVRQIEQADIQNYPKGLERVFDDFHSAYGVWPTSPGKLAGIGEPGDDFWFELSGIKSATINKRHIDFFTKDGSSLPTTDEEAGLWFKLEGAGATQRCVIQRMPQKGS